MPPFIAYAALVAILVSAAGAADYADSGVGDSCVNAQCCCGSSYTYNDGMMTCDSGSPVTTKDKCTGSSNTGSTDNCLGSQCCCSSSYNYNDGVMTCANGSPVTTKDKCSGSHNGTTPFVRVRYQATLKPTYKPAHNPPTGHAYVVIINASYAELSFNIMHAVNVTAAHIHSGITGGIIVPALITTYALSGSFSSALSFNPAVNNVTALMAANKTYFNVHTPLHPAGAVSGYFKKY